MVNRLDGHYGYRRLIAASLPLIVMNIVISIYSIVDGLFVSNLVGTTAFAALNLIWPAIGLVGALGLMVGTGGAALVSKTLGQGLPEQANRYFSMFVEFILLVSVVLSIPLIIWMRPLAVALGAEGDMIEQCVIYGRICAAGLPGFMLQLGFQPFFMVAGRPRMGTWLAIASGIINIALDALFIMGMGWGLAGAAAGSMIGCFVGGFYPLWYFSSRFNHTRLSFRPIGFAPTPIANACANGLSEFVGNISFNVVSMCYNLQLMHYYGENGVAAYSVILYIGFVFVAMFIGYNLAVTPLIGFNYGAGDRTELRSLLRHSLVLMSALGAVLCVAAQLIAQPVARLFVGYDPALTELTVHATRIYSMCFLLSGISMFVSAWFTGLNNGPVSAVASFCRTFVFELSCVFVLPAIVGMEGIWYSAPIAELLALLLGTALLLIFNRGYLY